MKKIISQCVVLTAATWAVAACDADAPRMIPDAASLSWSDTGADALVSPSIANACGNGRLDEGEVRDDQDLGGQSCYTQGYSAGTLACNAGSCSLNHDNCNIY
jgi:hypothetical protein